MLKNLFLLFVLFINFYLVFAKGEPIKFGLITDKEKEMTFYEKDSTAPAVVLCDLGEIEYKDYRLKFTRNLRIKIFKKEGYKYARHEFIMSKNAITPIIKAITYNSIGETTTEHKLNKNQIFRGQYDKNYDVLNFEMPAIREGSIIDLEYSYESGIFFIRPWYFQTTIPTCHSEYRVLEPAFLSFKLLEKGFYPIDTKTHEGNYYTFISKDVPAFYTEEYITCVENYLSSIQFEIGTIKMANQLVQNISNTWEAVEKILLEDPDFGPRIHGGRFIKDELDLIDSLYKIPEKKIEEVFQFIRNSMNWNNQNSLYSSDPKKAWQEKTGSSADINLLLVSALNRLGFDANPIILSTRANGFIHPAQIILDQFNYVIASVKLNDKNILLDATDKYTPIGILPERCLNGQGRMIKEKESCWVDLNPMVPQKEFFMTTMHLNQDGELTGSTNEKFEGYAAIEKRHKLDLYTNETDYFNEYQKNYQKLTMEFDSISNKTDLSKPITINYHFESDEIVEKVGNLLFINPLIINRIETNPFKLEQREYPVDFSFLKSSNYIVNLTIPESFTLENIPENKTMTLPDRTAIFFYTIKQTGNTISIVSKFNINKVIFLPEEYLNLKEFYNQVITVMSKKIILIKK